MITGVRTVITNWQVRCTSTLLHLHNSINPAASSVLAAFLFFRYDFFDAPNDRSSQDRPAGLGLLDLHRKWTSAGSWASKCLDGVRKSHRVEP